MMHLKFSTHLDSTNRKQLFATVAGNTFCLIITKVYALAWYLRKGREKYDYIRNLTKTFLAVLHSDLC